MAAGAVRQAPWNSITWTGSRELVFTERTGSACSAVRTTNTPLKRCTVARSWSERAHRATRVQPVQGFSQGERTIIRAGADALRYGVHAAVLPQGLHLEQRGDR